MSLFESVFEPNKKEVLKQKNKKKEISSTAGAIPVKNAKGDISMERVKVKRYVAGKIPDYAGMKTEETVETQVSVKKETREQKSVGGRHRQDHGRRAVFEPQIVKTFEQPEPEPATPLSLSVPRDEDAATRRQRLREELLRKDREEAAFVKQEATFEEAVGTESESESEVESSEEESEGESAPRLKPVFVSKADRITVVKSSDDVAEEEELLFAASVEKRKATTKEIIAELIQEEIAQENTIEGEENVVVTDDDDEETAFEQWKVRELQRMKRDIEEKAAMEAEKHEMERLRLMTEEERIAHLEANPKIITNRADKGKYKFLQKYYHRGAFYLDNEEDVLKQNFAEPTLEDHFDKSTLPEVMQVKNFGKVGRTKYTHLVDQDTSCFEGAWSKKNELAGTFSAKIGGGMKQQFERPGTKRTK